jgi:hypothetical protein
VAKNALAERAMIHRRERDRGRNSPALAIRTSAPAGLNSVSENGPQWPADGSPDGLFLRMTWGSCDVRSSHRNTRTYTLSPLPG